MWHNILIFFSFCRESDRMWQEAIGWMSFGEIKMGEMIISNKVYISEILRKGTKRMFHRIRERKPIPFLYCVVLPFWESAVLEIYEYHELLSDLYEEKEVVIVGLAAGKEDALVLVRRIIDDLASEGKIENVETPKNPAK